MHQRWSPIQGLEQGPVQYSGLTISRLGSSIRYSRHLSLPAQPISSREGSRIVMFSSARPRTSNNLTPKSQTIDCHHDLQIVRYFPSYRMYHLLITVFQKVPMVLTPSSDSSDHPQQWSVTPVSNTRFYHH